MTLLMINLFGFNLYFQWSRETTDSWLGFANGVTHLSANDSFQDDQELNLDIYDASQFQVIHVPIGPIDFTVERRGGPMMVGRLHYAHTKTNRVLEYPMLVNAIMLLAIARIIDRRTKLSVPARKENSTQRDSNV